MLATGFSNCWTCGEIAPEAWDRVDLQPVQKGCEEALNLTPMIQGPLQKRRGFWRLGSVADPTKSPRLFPVSTGIDSALMLEIGDGIAHVWTPAGDPLLNNGAQVSFALPFFQAELDQLRCRQVGDVLYFTRGGGGLPPIAVSHVSDTQWTWTLIDFRNGPWLGENADQNVTIRVDQIGGALQMLPGGVVNLTASVDMFQPGHAGARYRLRPNSGTNPGVLTWAPATAYNPGDAVLSAGRVYTKAGGAAKSGTTPPVHDRGTASDGAISWAYFNDGAGVVAITAYRSSRLLTGTVLAAIPFNSGETTTCWSEGAYSPYRGYPSAQAALREERLVYGGTVSGPDQLDLSETAGFSPTAVSFAPGLGTGQVVDTDAVRRRLGDDRGLIQWAAVSTYLVAATRTGEYLVAGSVLDEPISPASVVVKRLSSFGAEHAAPVLAHDALLYIAQGGQTLRELRVDQNQIAANRDLTVLAGHIGRRGLAQLAWVRQPDDTLWVRTADGGLCAYAYHVEQQVQGFTSTALGGGWTVEDMAVMPGPLKRDTLWIVASRTAPSGAFQRVLMFLSTEEDALFMDAAEFYSGAPTTRIAGLDHLEGETVRILADGAEVPAQVVAGGAIRLSRPASVVNVGLPYLARFKSLRLDLQSSKDLRQRLVGALVSLTHVVSRVGTFGAILEKLSSRLASDTLTVTARRDQASVTFAGDSARDPRVTVEDDSAYPLMISSLKPKVQAGAGA